MTTVKHKLQPTVKPDAAYGLEVIDKALTFFNYFIKQCKTKAQRKHEFVIFRQSVQKHLLDKYAGYDDFGGFYLNLDNDCWERLLHHGFDEDINLKAPELPEWKELAVKYNIKTDSPLYEMDEVRKLTVMFGDKTRWDITPHAMEWIRLFILYACNHSLDGYEFDEPVKSEFKAYTGNKFGNYKYWNMFWQKCSPEAKKAIVEKLVDYD
jgi:hypothetical protein